MGRSLYFAPIENFLVDHRNFILGELSNNYEFKLDDQQKNAWKYEIDLLKRILIDFSGSIYFEFIIPRMGKRVDVVLLLSGIIFVLEFKYGENLFPKKAINQVMDYSLDLKYFHETSHDLPIVPILISSKGKSIDSRLISYSDNVFQPLLTNNENLRSYLLLCIQKINNKKNISPIQWENGKYQPTPTIIETARALYLGHKVQEISRSDAGGKNLRDTSDAVDEIIEKAKNQNQKSIVFITGVPGAGKTLAGLNIANHRMQVNKNENAVFLSGNGPLVKVLREALIRDDVRQGENRKSSERKARAFIQNIHHFRDEYLVDEKAPIEHIVVFDEAQRAWDKNKAKSFMKRKKGKEDFHQSEPEFLIRVMDRHIDWAVIICLVGGGQEINAGEAGLIEWFITLSQVFKNWKVYVSNQVGDSEFLRNQEIKSLLPATQLNINNKLHLAVSVRSFRSEHVSNLVKALLDLNINAAKEFFSLLQSKYPIYLCRDINKARKWLRENTRGNERSGIIATSGGIRLRPDGLFVKSKIEVEHWFLDDIDDVRSSNSLEEVSTEFDIQGLELDWTCVAWDADLRLIKGSWVYKNFRGSKWTVVKSESRKNYLINAYRVLLTRARQGMIIFVPLGSEKDITRLPNFYNGTYQYLKGIGIPEVA